MPKEASKTVTIALAGNPNSGKTTIFNSLTGARQHVGNYPGVTVEKKEGEVRHAGWRIKVVDLPGTYSLTAYSLEETVARDFVLRDSPQMVVDVVDESNLERNLYLAVQFMEMGVPLVLDFNMSDVATRMGYQVDVEKLSALLGVPIVKTVGHKGEGVRELLDAIVRVAEGELSATPAEIHYGAEIEEEMRKLVPLLEQMDKLPMPASPRWTALKLIEGDDRVVESVKAASDMYAPVSGEIVEVNAALEDEPELVNSDPYGDGWILRIQLDDKGELENLLKAEAYEALQDE